MGLIYDSSDSAVRITAMQVNIDAGQDMADGTNGATAALSSHTLSGATYTAGKGMLRN